MALIVKPHEHSSIDFTKEIEARTSGLEHCIAVATRLPSRKTGTLSHLTLADDLGRPLRWIVDNTVRDSEVYLIGGRSPESDNYLGLLREGLELKGYVVNDSETLGKEPIGRNLILRLAGPIEIEMYRTVRTALGEEQVILGVRYL